MAYTTYTPTAAKFVDVDLPDDSELETSGIGAVDTPIEDIADGLLYATEEVQPAVATGFSGYTTVLTVDSATMTSYTDVTISNGAAADVAITVPADNVGIGGRIICTFEFMINTSTGTGCFIDVFSSATGAALANTETYFTSATAINIPVSLSFSVSASAAATTFTLRAKCATNSWLIYGPVRMHAIRVRDT